MEVEDLFLFLKALDTNMSKLFHHGAKECVACAMYAKDNFLDPMTKNMELRDNLFVFPMPKKY